MEFFVFFVLKPFRNPNIILIAKYTISTAVMMENPVRSPIVPPISESMFTNVVALSLVTLVNTRSTNFILINLRSCRSPSSKKIIYNVQSIVKESTLIGLSVCYQNHLNSLHILPAESLVCTRRLVIILSCPVFL